MTHSLFYDKGRALYYLKEIDVFLSKRENRDLRDIELSNTEWEVIRTVTDWLFVFRKATVSMSTTKQPMLSNAHATLKGLQDKLRDSIKELPRSAAVGLRDALVAAHNKLGEYLFKVDESPYTVWASCEQNIYIIFYH